MSILDRSKGYELQPISNNQLNRAQIESIKNSKQVNRNDSEDHNQFLKYRESMQKYAKITPTSNIPPFYLNIFMGIINLAGIAICIYFLYYRCQNYQFFIVLPTFLISFLINYMTRSNTSRYSYKFFMTLYAIAQILCFILNIFFMLDVVSDSFCGYLICHEEFDGTWFNQASFKQSVCPQILRDSK